MSANLQPVIKRNTCEKENHLGKGNHLTSVKKVRDGRGVICLGFNLCPEILNYVLNENNNNTIYLLIFIFYLCMDR